MEDIRDILKRYYQGTTTLEEERILKAAYRQNELQDAPILAYQKDNRKLPENLIYSIKHHTYKCRNNRKKSRWIIAAGIAAMLVLIISLRYLLPVQKTPGLQLSDNLKKERFENALRIIGNVLEENTPPIQKVLYEDNKLIIAIE